MAQLKDTTVLGSLRATDTLFSTTSQFQILRAPTSSGGTTYGPGSDKQILQSNGTSVYWSSITPSISITAGTNSAAPKVNLTVGGVSGNAQSITTATTNVYGVTKLTNSFTSTDENLAVTGKAINAALQTLDSTLPSGSGANKTLTGLTITDGKIESATFKDILIDPSQISGAVPVRLGGTGTTTLTNGAVLIGNGTSSVNTRAITNNTSATAVTASTNIITANTLYYHTGNSNIKTVGTISSGTWKGTAIAAAYIGEHSTDKLTSGTLGTGRGGTGIDTYTLGDILYSSAANTLSKLSGNTTTTRKFLRSVATTSGTATAPVWDTLTKTDVGLGNVENVSAVAKSGDTMTGSLLIDNTSLQRRIQLSADSINLQYYGENSGPDQIKGRIYLGQTDNDNHLMYINAPSGLEMDSSAQILLTARSYLGGSNNYGQLRLAYAGVLLSQGTANEAESRISMLNDSIEMDVSKKTFTEIDNGDGSTSTVEQFLPVSSVIINENGTTIAGSLSLSNALAIDYGGTGATTAASARANIGALGISDVIDNLTSTDTQKPASANIATMLFRTPTTTLSNIDLDTIIDPGVYTVDDTCTNKPPILANGKLIVVYPGHINYPRQIYMSGYDSYIYTRTRWYNSSTTSFVWHPWEKLISSSDINNYVAKNNPTQGEITDLNNATETGIYSYSGNTTNAPTTSGSAVFVISNAYASQVLQICRPNNYDSIQFRTKSGNTWNSWKSISTTSDIVNNLTSTATDKPLSAAQGKALNDKIKTDTIALTPHSNVTLSYNQSHYITDKIIHILCRVKVDSVPSTDFTAISLPNGISFSNSGLVFPVFKASGEWSTPNQICYCYQGINGFGLHPSDLTSGCYITVDFIARIQ